MIYEINIDEVLEAHDHLGGKVGTRPTNANAAVKFSAGESFTRRTGRWSYREQRYDHENDYCWETVRDQETGNLLFAKGCRLSEKDKSSF
jgi:hypothetical protein